MKIKFSKVQLKEIAQNSSKFLGLWILIIVILIVFAIIGIILFLRYSKFKKDFEKYDNTQYHNIGKIIPFEDDNSFGSSE